MKNNKVKNPVTALILGLITSAQEPLIRRDKDGDIAVRFGDNRMVFVGLRNPVLEKDPEYHKKTKAEKELLKEVKSLHNSYGKKLNSDKSKEEILSAMQPFIANERIRMNATLIVT